MNPEAIKGSRLETCKEIGLWEGLAVKCRFKFLNREYEAIQYNNLNKAEIDEFVGSKLPFEINDGAYKATGKIPPVRILYLAVGRNLIPIIPGSYVVRIREDEFLVVSSEEFKEQFELVKEEG